jgi:hypothetical protein
MSMTGDYNGAGLTLIHNNDGYYSILLAKSNSYKPNKKNVWIFGGGGKEKDENPIQTAYREFMEEIFNIHIDIKVVDEIIELIKGKKEFYDVNTNISNNREIPSYTFLQTSNALTIMVNTLDKHKIYSDVFPFGYDGLYNHKKEIDVHNFCSQRRYIIEKCMPEKNEIVFIVMVPIDNLVNSITKCKTKDVYHYHGENLRIYVPSVMKQIKLYLTELENIKLLESISL